MHEALSQVTAMPQLDMHEAAPQVRGRLQVRHASYREATSQTHGGPTIC